MVLLVLFAFVAGAGTALSPCVLPVLPAVLSAGVTGGRRRPLGVVTGLALSFTFAVVALVYLIDALGLPDALLRNIAIGVLLVFGVTLLVPPVADRVEAWVSRFAGRPAMTRGEGFGSGLVLGASLGLVYAPCAGPILAGVITVSAAQDFTVGRLAVALAYGAGSAAVLYALVLGRQAARGPAVGLPRPRPGRARGRDDRDGGPDVRGARPRVPERDRRRPAGRAGQPHRRARGERCGRRRPRRRARRARRERGRRGGGRERGGAARPRAVARLHPHPELVQHRGRRGALDRGADRRRPRRADRLLDLHLHQLHPHAAPPQVVGRRIPRRRPDDRRRARAGVPVRARRRQRLRRDRVERDRRTRSSRTTSSARGPPSATSTGPRSTS